jgi:hypothetical protein
VLWDLLDILDIVEWATVWQDVSHWHMSRKSRDWPLAPVTFMSRSEKDCGKLVLSFAYSVEGERYGGYLDGKVGNASPQFVRYDPRRPERYWVP